MIRPITMICWLLALSAGLYLYRAKHEVELIDKHIEQIAKDTNDLRVESRHYLDEWIRLGQPEQLRKYSDTYLGLRTILPTQFVRLADLPARLPAPRADPVEPALVASASVGSSVAAPALPLNQSSAGTDMASADDNEDDLPLPPIPPVVPVAATLTTVSMPASIPLQARPVTPRPAAQPAATQPAATQPAATQPAATLADRDPIRSRVPPEARAPELRAPELRTGEDQRLAAAKAAPVKLAEPHPVVAAPMPGSSAPNGQAYVQQRPLPPLSAPGPGQGPMPVQVQARELPPLQAQGAGQITQPRQPEPRIADTFANDRQRDLRTAPLQAQQEQRAPMPPMARQTPPPVPSSGQSMTGSMLGMSRGLAAPVPTPTPVNATWTSPR